VIGTGLSIGASDPAPGSSVGLGAGVGLGSGVGLLGGVGLGAGLGLGLGLGVGERISGSADLTAGVRAGADRGVGWGVGVAAGVGDGTATDGKAWGCTGAGAKEIVSSSTSDSGGGSFGNRGNPSTRACITTEIRNQGRSQLWRGDRGASGGTGKGREVSRAAIEGLEGGGLNMAGIG